MKRFWEKVVVGGPDDCWEWQAGSLKGYGRFSFDGRPRYAHRVAYLLEIGEIPAGLCVLHTCDNPPCCNPAHLFLGTRVDNIMDMVAKGRQGHGGRRLPRVMDEQLHEIRSLTAAGWLGKDVAAAYGLSRGHVSRIHTGKRRPTALERSEDLSS